MSGVEPYKRPESSELYLCYFYLITLGSGDSGSLESQETERKKGDTDGQTT